MTHSPKHNRARLRKLPTWIMAGAALLTLGACAYGSAPENANEKFPIQVAREQISISIAIPEQGQALAPDDARRLQAFLRDFVQRGRTHMTVETVSPAAAKAMLTASGLRANELIIVTDTSTPAPHAALSFTANTVKVPTCADWSDNSGFAPMNNSHQDYGCSVRRNTGLTVADPGDLIQSQPMSGGRAARRDAAMDLYNSGEKVGTTGDTGIATEVTTSQ